MLPLSWQLHLAVRVITMEKGHGQAGTGSHTGDMQALNGVVGKRSQELTIY